MSRQRIEKVVRRLQADDTVLDVGCARHDSERRKKGNLHAEIVEEVDKVIGIDVIASEVEAMQDEGFDVRVADAEALESDAFEEEFDVVVAGELIEHLSNPGLFLDGAHRVTAPTGRMVITTPNPHCLAYTRKALLAQKNNTEHTCWFDEQFIGQLATRHGWSMTDIEYDPPTGGVSRIGWWIDESIGGPAFVAEFEKENAVSG